MEEIQGGKPTDPLAVSHEETRRLERDLGLEPAAFSAECSLCEWHQPWGRDYDGLMPSKADPRLRAWCSEDGA
jgi:hypothetical protein